MKNPFIIFYFFLAFLISFKALAVKNTLRTLKVSTERELSQLDKTLIEASKNGHKQVVEIFLYKGADSNAKNKYDQISALMKPLNRDIWKL